MGTYLLLEMSKEMHSKLEQNIAKFSAQGFNHFHLLLGVGADLVIRELEIVQTKYNLTIDYTIESIPLGTGGALVNALPSLNETFFVVHGDLYIDSPISEMENSLSNSEVEAVQIYHPSSHPSDSDLLEIDQQGYITNYHLKPRKSEVDIRNFGNAGVYLFQKKLFTRYKKEKLKVDLDRELLPELLSQGAKFKASRNLGYIKDAGTPERLAEVLKDIKNEVKTKVVRPALFLDRDGTLNLERGHISDPDEIELFADCIRLIKRCNENGLRVIVITNQPVIARGELSYEGLNLIHARIDKILSKSGAYIDDYFFCPHHPDGGYKSEIENLKVICICRKPGIGLFYEALKVYPTSTPESLMVGDTWRDVEAGEKMGLKTVLIDRGGINKIMNVNPNIRVSSLDQILPN
jgi:histidinol-phosphate phosphatase family protein